MLTKILDLCDSFANIAGNMAKEPDCKPTAKPTISARIEHSLHERSLRVAGETGLDFSTVIVAGLTLVCEKFEKDGHLRFPVVSGKYSDGKDRAG